MISVQFGVCESWISCQYAYPTVPVLPVAKFPLIGSSFTTTTIPVLPKASDAPVKNAALPGVQVPAAPEAVLPLSGKAISKVTLPGTANPLDPVRLGETCETTVPAFTEAEVAVKSPAPPHVLLPQVPLPQAKVLAVVPV